jgi:uncharacterized protein YecE (DUF72 family)
MSMTELYVGAGGWAYFKVQGMSPLKTYSKAFGFVEVNSTFYALPAPGVAEGWRRAVPPGFRFAVRANRVVTHKDPFLLTPEADRALQGTLEVCQALKADVLHFQAPPSFRIDAGASRRLDEFFGSLKAGTMLLALEARGREEGKGGITRLPDAFTETLRDHNVLHCVDLLKGERPANGSRILYTRIFGKGEHNIYQPDDGELGQIHAYSERHEKAYVTFHGARMYSDAARLTAFERTGRFPAITPFLGAESLKSVLEEDSKFPATKQDLIRDVGWKLFDASEAKRMRVEEALRLIPEGVYGNVNDVTAAVQPKGKHIG